jgi:SAM-dependent methyltransferase
VPADFHIPAATLAHARTTGAIRGGEPSAVEQYLDPLTIYALEASGVPPGVRCLELGPGGGSIARWLAGQVGPAGQVIAVDRHPGQPHPTPNLQCHQRDLRYGLPPEVTGPFDLIHARLVLAHLPNRHRLLRQLVEALTPGGWIVLGEFSSHPPVVYTAGRRHDAALFTRVLDVFTNVLIRQHGLDTRWAHQLYPALAQAGLREVSLVEHAQSWTGGHPGCRVHTTNLDRLHDQLIAAGLTQAELDQFHQLMDDPRFTARSWRFISARGRKPATRVCHHRPTADGSPNGPAGRPLRG